MQLVKEAVQPTTNVVIILNHLAYNKWSCISNFIINKALKVYVAVCFMQITDEDGKTTSTKPTQ